MKKVIYRLFGLAILAVAGWYGYRFVEQLPQRSETIATAKVQKSEVVIRAFSRGELRAVRSYSITAPNLFGTVQVTRLAPMGALAHEKDLIVEYDDSERQAALEENKLEVQSVDESIKQLKAQQGITQSQDAVNLLKARYDVRRAELEVQRNPIIDVIDAKKNILQLDQTKRALQQLEADIQARQEQADSQLAVYQEQRNRSMLDVTRELQRIAQTKALTPITGLVSIRQNRFGNFNFGQQLPDIREGDQLMPGMPVADVLDLSEVEVWTKIGELDRANLNVGQDAILQLDAIPDKQFHGKIKSMSGTATSDVFSGDPSKKFDVVFSVDMRQLLSGLGMKPAEVEKVMTTAAENAKKNIANAGPSLFSSLQAAPGGGPGANAGAMPNAIPGMASMQAANGMPGMPGGDTQAQDGSVRRSRGQGGAQARREDGGRGRGGLFAGLSGENRQKAGQIMQQMQKASPEERKKLVEQLTRLNSGRSGQGRGQAGAGDQAAPMAQMLQRLTSGTPEEQRQMIERVNRMMAGGGRGDGGQGFMGGGTGRAGDNTLEALMRRYANTGGFTEEERNNAKLPLPPEEDSQVRVLLRPGLLADVEIVVERIPDALHVPTQAVFTKNGKPTVFVRQKNGSFEPREVRLAKQSESVMVLAGGVSPGEVVALSDPTADRSAKKNQSGNKSQANPMGSMPGGK